MIKLLIFQCSTSNFLLPPSMKNASNVLIKSFYLKVISKITLARTCDYTIEIEGHDVKCINTIGVREILFKNTEYMEQSIRCILCNSHYLEVFGWWILREQQLLRNYLNAKFRYYKDLAHAKKYGEYFNEFDFKFMNYPRVERELTKWLNHKFKVCAYEICDVKLDSMKRVFQIIIDKPSGMYDRQLRCCSKQHWKKYIYQTGKQKPPNPNQKPKKIINMDTFLG